jgi:hypothetical protein
MTLPAQIPTLLENLARLGAAGVPIAGIVDYVNESVTPYLDTKIQNLNNALNLMIESTTRLDAEGLERDRLSQKLDDVLRPVVGEASAPMLALAADALLIDRENAWFTQYLGLSLSGAELESLRLRHEPTYKRLLRAGPASAAVEQSNSLRTCVNKALLKLLGFKGSVLDYTQPGTEINI